MNSLVPSSKLLEAKQLVQDYRVGREPPGTTEKQVNLTRLGDLQFISHLFVGDPGHAAIQVCISPRLRGTAECIW